MKNTSVKLIFLISLLLLFFGCDIFTDFESPKVRILSPKQDEIVYGSVDIVVEASDNKKIDRVELYLDGVLAKNFRQASFTFNWDLTETKADTIHSVCVKVFDKNDNWSEEKIEFFGYGRSPDKPILLSPSSGVNVWLDEITLAWTDIPNVAYYHLQVDNNPDFSSPHLTVTDLADSEFNLKAEMVTKNSYWKVRAIYDWSEWGPWSDTWSFYLSAVKWSIHLEGKVSSSLALDREGCIYFGAANGCLYSLYSDGSLRWKFQTGGKIDSAPTIGADGSIYVGSDDGTLYAIQNDGAFKWSYETAAEINSSPALSVDDIIYFGSNDYYLYALNHTGELIWKYKTGDPIYSSPAIGFDGTIYFGSNDRNVYALNPDGTLKWQYQTGDEIEASPAVDNNGNVYIGSFDENLYSFDANGTLNWSYNVGANATPVITNDGNIISTANDIYIISASGIVVWWKSALPFLNTPAIDLDGMIYVGSNNTSDMIPIGDFYALDSMGNRIKSYEIGPIGENRQESNSPVISSHGIIYMNTLDGRLHAIYSCGASLANSHWPKFQHDNQNTGRAGN